MHYSAHDFHKYSMGWMTYCPLNKPVGHSYRVFMRDDMYILTDRHYEENLIIREVCKQIEEQYGATVELKWICRNGKFTLIRIIPTGSRN